MADKLDPFDVGALEKSLNDSATRVSAIWITFLTFGLYLVIAAGTITHRQLFLEDPIKLPVLNIELPLIGFFFLAPILFVIFHAYVLLQVLLLGRTAAAYNNAVDRAITTAPANAAMRQRLANTLFAQIFAGSPRERDGWLGWLLKAMAWFTLAIAPVLILFVFQFQFLPYHSEPVTWAIRFLIVIDLAIILVLWPAARDPGHEVTLRGVFRQWVALPIAIVTAAFAWIVLTFPGERHAEWTRYWPDEDSRKNAPKFEDGLECQTRSLVSRLFPSFDRLYLPRVDVVDDEKLEKIEGHTKKVGEPDYQGERTRLLHDRDFNCAYLGSYADLRRVDFAQSSVRGASFIFSKLQGASFEGTQLQGTSLDIAQLQGASLNSAQLQGASLYAAQLQGATLERAQLQGASLYAAQLRGASLEWAQLRGASLEWAQLQGAFLEGAQLQGASLERAQLQSAFLEEAQLQGASLERAQLQGASLERAQLQGAFLEGAQLQGASLERAQLQGAFLGGAALTETVISKAAVWHARNAKCEGARVQRARFSAIIQFNRDNIRKSVWATPEATKKFIDDAITRIPDKQVATARMRAGLVVDPAKDDTAAIARVWRDCEEESAKVPQAEFDKKHAAFLRDLVCDAKESRDAIAKGIIRNWISDEENRRAFSARLARGLLGDDGKPCAATRDLDEYDKEKLRTAIAAAEEAAKAEPEPLAAAVHSPASAASAPVAAPAAAAAPSPAASQASNQINRGKNPFVPAQAGTQR